jgi:hypothetical protein
MPGKTNYYEVFNVDIGGWRARMISGHIFDVKGTLVNCVSQPLSLCRRNELRH